jgi:hypothetical protein
MVAPDAESVGGDGTERIRAQFVPASVPRGAYDGINTSMPRRRGNAPGPAKEVSSDAIPF